MWGAHVPMASPWAICTPPLGSGTKTTDAMPKAARPVGSLQIAHGGELWGGVPIFSTP